MTPYHANPDAEEKNSDWITHATADLSIRIGLELFGCANRIRNDIEDLVLLFKEYACHHLSKI